MNEIFRRVSVRRFQDRPVGGEKAELLLRAAMAAPSAGNQQPWEFYVVTNRMRLGELAACSPYAGCLKNAPLGIVVCCRKDCPMPEYAQIDCSAAIENLLLEAVSQGLGAGGVAWRRAFGGADGGCPAGTAASGASGCVCIYSLWLSRGGAALAGPV